MTKSATNGWRPVKRRQFLCGSVSLASAAMLGSSSALADAAAGFHLPDEAKPHQRTFMQWPASRTVHPNRAHLKRLQKCIAALANTVSEFEPVVMLMDIKFEAAARRWLGQGVEIWNVPTDDLWCRDSGPLFVTNSTKELAVMNFGFNGWGDKQVHPNDGDVAKRVAARLGLELIDAGVVGEPGGIESDGEGTLMAHESSWLNINRNEASKAVVEERLKSALGAGALIWAPGLKGQDITDYHIDALARFVRPGLVAIQLPDEPDAADPWSAAAFKTYEILSTARDAKGRALQLAKLPEPKNIRSPIPDFVAAYVNYYVCNGALITAEFGDEKSDAEAKARLQQLYPGREVVALNVDPLGEIGGGIHCATQQQPRV